MPRKFNYNVSVDAETEAEAQQKMQAVTTMLKNLNARELAKLANVIEKEPTKVKLAKNFLGLG